VVEHLPVLVWFVQLAEPTAVEAASLVNAGCLLNCMYHQGMRTPLC